MDSNDVGEDGATLTRAKSGDATAFAQLADRNRDRLYRHCYRMLGSGHDAEEAVQDTLLRAWQRLDTFDGRGSFPGWMYRIATNLCIDRLRGQRRRLHPVSLGPPAPPGAMPQGPEAGIDWVEPVGDETIGLASDPEQLALARERVSLAFVAALQQLSPRQRAVLLLHDVLDFTHDEVAEVIDASPSAVNSLLYRARRTIASSPIVVPADPDDPAVLALLERYMRAWEFADIAEFLATVSDDVRFSMPPLSTWYEGAASVGAFIEAAVFGPGGRVPMKLGRANGQPAIATYTFGPDGKLTIDGLQVLDVDAESVKIAAITSFRDPKLAVACGFPQALKST